MPSLDVRNSDGAAAASSSTVKDLCHSRTCIIDARSPTSAVGLTQPRQSEASLDDHLAAGNLNGNRAPGSGGQCRDLALEDYIGLKELQAMLQYFYNPETLPKDGDKSAGHVCGGGETCPGEQGGGEVTIPALLGDFDVEGFLLRTRQELHYELQRRQTTLGGFLPQLTARAATANGPMDCCSATAQTTPRFAGEVCDSTSPGSVSQRAADSSRLWLLTVAQLVTALERVLTPVVLPCTARGALRESGVASGEGGRPLTDAEVLRAKIEEFVQRIDCEQFGVVSWDDVTTFLLAQNRHRLYVAKRQKELDTTPFPVVAPPRRHQHERVTCILLDPAVPLGRQPPSSVASAADMSAVMSALDNNCTSVTSSNGSGDSCSDSNDFFGREQDTRPTDHGIVYARRRSTIFTGGSEGTVRVWDSETLQHRRLFFTADDWIVGLCFTERFRYLLVTTLSRQLILLDTSGNNDVVRIFVGKSLLYSPSMLTTVDATSSTTVVGGAKEDRYGHKGSLGRGARHRRRLIGGTAAATGPICDSVRPRGRGAPHGHRATLRAAAATTGGPQKSEKIMPREVELSFLAGLTDAPTCSDYFFSPESEEIVLFGLTTGEVRCYVLPAVPQRVLQPIASFFPHGRTDPVREDTGPDDVEGACEEAAGKSVAATAASPRRPNGARWAISGASPCHSEMMRNPGINQIQVVPSISGVLTCADDGTLRLSSLRDGSLLRCFTRNGHQKAVSAFAFLPSLHMVLTVGTERHGIVWDLYSDAAIAHLSEHDAPCVACAVACGKQSDVHGAAVPGDPAPASVGQLLITVASDSTIHIHDTQSFSKIEVIYDQPGEAGQLTLKSASPLDNALGLGHYVSECDEHAEGDHFDGESVAGASDAWLHRLGGASSKLRPLRQVTAVRFDDHNGRLVCGTSFPYQYSMKRTAAACPVRYQGHMAAMAGVRYNVSRKQITTIDVDGQAMIWTAEKGELTLSIFLHEVLLASPFCYEPNEVLVTAVGFDEMHKYFLTGFHGGTVVVWNHVNGQPVTVITAAARSNWYEQHQEQQAAAKASRRQPPPPPEKATSDVAPLVPADCENQLFSLMSSDSGGGGPRPRAHAAPVPDPFLQPTSRQEVLAVGTCARNGRQTIIYAVGSCLYYFLESPTFHITATKRFTVPGELGNVQCLKQISPHLVACGTSSGSLFFFNILWERVDGPALWLDEVPPQTSRSANATAYLGLDGSASRSTTSAPQPSNSLGPNTGDGSRGGDKKPNPQVSWARNQKAASLSSFPLRQMSSFQRKSQSDSLVFPAMVKTSQIVQLFLLTAIGDVLLVVHIDGTIVFWHSIQRVVISVVNLKRASSSGLPLAIVKCVCIDELSNQYLAFADGSGNIHVCEMRLSVKGDQPLSDLPHAPDGSGGDSEHQQSGVAVKQMRSKLLAKDATEPIAAVSGATRSTGELPGALVATDSERKLQRSYSKRSATTYSVISFKRVSLFQSGIRSISSLAIVCEPTQARVPGAMKTADRHGADLDGKVAIACCGNGYFTRLFTLGGRSIGELGMDTFHLAEKSTYRFMGDKSSRRMRPEGLPLGLNWQTPWEYVDRQRSYSSFRHTLSQRTASMTRRSSQRMLREAAQQLSSVHTTYPSGRENDESRADGSKFAPRLARADRSEPNASSIVESVRAPTSNRQSNRTALASASLQASASAVGFVDSSPVSTRRRQCVDQWQTKVSVGRGRGIVKPKFLASTTEPVLPRILRKQDSQLVLSFVPAISRKALPSLPGATQGAPPSLLSPLLSKNCSYAPAKTQPCAAILSPLSKALPEIRATELKRIPRSEPNEGEGWPGTANSCHRILREKAHSQSRRRVHESLAERAVSAAGAAKPAADVAPPSATNELSSSWSRSLSDNVMLLSALGSKNPLLCEEMGRRPLEVVSRCDEMSLGIPCDFNAEVAPGGQLASRSMRAPPKGLPEAAGVAALALPAVLSKPGSASRLKPTAACPNSLIRGKKTRYQFPLPSTITLKGGAAKPSVL